MSRLLAFPGTSERPRLPALGAIASTVPPQVDGSAVPHPLVAKVARLVLCSVIGTEFVDKIVTSMLDELE